MSTARIDTRTSFPDVLFLRPKAKHIKSALHTHSPSLFSLSSFYVAHNVRAFNDDGHPDDVGTAPVALVWIMCLLKGCAPSVYVVLYIVSIRTACTVHIKIISYTPTAQFYCSQSAAVKFKVDDSVAVRRRRGACILYSIQAPLFYG